MNGSIVGQTEVEVKTMRPAVLVLVACAAFGLVVTRALAAPRRLVIHSPRFGVLNLMGTQGTGLIAEAPAAERQIVGRT
jgi:hypothetical protein